MNAKIIDGKSLAATVRKSVAQTIQTLAARGVRPGLAVVLAGFFFHFFCILFFLFSLFFPFLL